MNRTADYRDRQVGESYKDYAARMAGMARAAERDRDEAERRLAEQVPVAPLADLAVLGRIVETVTALVERAERNGDPGVDVAKLRRALNASEVHRILGRAPALRPERCGHDPDRIENDEVASDEHDRLCLRIGTAE